MKNENIRANKTGEKEISENRWKEITLRKIKQQMKSFFIEFSMDMALVVGLF
jgi:hypothetical protein